MLLNKFFPKKSINTGDHTNPTTQKEAIQNKVPDSQKDSQKPPLDTSPNNQNTPSLDTGLHCFILVAKLHGISADPDQIKHAFAIDSSGMKTLDILRVAKELGLKAKAINPKIDMLPKLKLPAILKMKNGKYIILAQIHKDTVLTLDMHDNTPKSVKIQTFQAEWTGEIILITYRGLKKFNEESFGFLWFIPSIIKYKKPLFQVLLAAFTIQVLGLFAPMITQVVIDKVLVHKGVTTLDVLAFGLIAVALFEMLMGIAKTYVFTHTTSRIDVILGARLFKHLLSLHLRYFETRRVGDTIARVRELENIRNFLTGSPLTSLLDVIFMIVYIAVMLFYSSTLTWIVLASLPFFAGLSIFVTPIFKRRLEEKFNYGAESQSYLVEVVNGIQTVKSFALEPEVQKKWEHQMANYVKSGFKTAILAGNASNIAQLIQKVSDIAVLWFGAHLVMTDGITVGQLIAFRMLSSRVSGPVLRLVQLWQDFQQTGISIKRLGDIFNTRPEPALDPAKAKLPPIKGMIKFEKVRFRYRVDTAEVIRDMSFEINPGTVVGIVGRSGSGKSTISKLMQRLYIPEAGKILIDGVDISLADPSWLRRQVGVVLQENFLFNATVRENICIQYPSANMKDIIRVAQIAGAHEFILELPEGYDTMIGEKGTGLSGGQKQRIAIARALLTNPKVLIFDEATSALDYESESIIQKNLKLICKGRTVIIIAHRLSTLKDAHLIMSIDRGQLIEYGSHEELLKRKGLYQYLHSQQERKEVS